MKFDSPETLLRPDDHREGPAPRHGLKGVQSDVPEDLFEPVPFGLDREGLDRLFEPDVDSGAVLLALLEQEEGLLQGGHQVTSPSWRPRHPHLIEKLAGDQFEAIRLSDDQPQELLMSLAL